MSKIFNSNYFALLSELKFPSFIKDQDFITLMKKMLSKSCITRLCKFELIKIEPWLRGFNWEGLSSFSLEPPYTPKFVDDLQGKEKFTQMAFVNYIKNLKDFKPKKNTIIDKKTQHDYDEWFKKF
jgi:hypothetical protein